MQKKCCWKKYLSYILFPGYKILFSRIKKLPTAGIEPPTSATPSGDTTTRPYVLVLALLAVLAQQSVTRDGSQKNNNNKKKLRDAIADISCLAKNITRKSKQTFKSHMIICNIVDLESHLNPNSIEESTKTVVASASPPLPAHNAREDKKLLRTKSKQFKRYPALKVQNSFLSSAPKRHKI